GRSLRALRRRLQIVLQDARSALDPRMRAGDAIEQPLIALHRGLTRPERRRRVLATMERVGLAPDLAGRLPFALSGGQCRRVVLARGLAARPQLLVCDEHFGGLDLPLQAQLVNLLRDLRQALGLTLLVIAHDLAIVRHMSDRVLVMYLGRVVELAPCDDL